MPPALPPLSIAPSRCRPLGWHAACARIAVIDRAMDAGLPTETVRAVAASLAPGATMAARTLAAAVLRTAGHPALAEAVLRMESHP